MNLLSLLCIVVPICVKEIAAFQPHVVFQSSSCRKRDLKIPMKESVAGDDDFLRTKATAVVTSAMVLSMLFAPPAFAADIGKGETLFQANCAGCHAGGNNFVSEQRTLRKAAIQTYRGTLDAAPIQEFVQKGMPHRLLPMKTPMEDNDYSDVVAYVLDQALGEKW